MDAAFDTAARLAAFDYLAQVERENDGLLPWAPLAAGFELRGQRIKLVSQQGIFKPRCLDIPISIRTTPPSAQRDQPYDDGFSPEGFLRYRYRGTDPQAHDNRTLRLAMTRSVPLVYLYGVAPGVYVGAWPAFVVGDDPRDLSFLVAFDEARMMAAPIEEAVAEATVERRRYVTTAQTQRLHQRSFRERVLRAYRRMCSVCRLRHPELLDAAHILADRHPLGEPLVSNGLSLCKLHHAAFDKDILGIRPDAVVEVRVDILEEEDGPMLRYGLQAAHGVRLTLPQAVSLRPKAEFLEERYEQFRAR